MAQDALVQYILGPLGGFVVIIMVLGAIIRGTLVPRRFHDWVAKRNELLEVEHAELNEAVVRFTEQNTVLREEISALRMEIKYLNEEHDRLSGIS